MFMFELHITKVGFLVMMLDRFLFILYLKQSKDAMCCAYAWFSGEWEDVVPHVSFLKQTLSKWHTTLHRHVEEVRQLQTDRNIGEMNIPWRFIYYPPVCTETRTQNQSSGLQSVLVIC
jgi:hypothetical protein